MAKRFDRWIASPKNMYSPQCYDEFMTQEELPCLIEGCDWVGVHLGLHVNQAHGIAARDFKRATGFNYGTGLVGIELHKIMSNRAQNQVVPTPPEGFGGGIPRDYTSLEGIEHRKKAWALWRLRHNRL